MSASPDASEIAVHGLVAAFVQARWSENSVALSRLTTWSITVRVLATSSQASTLPRTSGCTCSSLATGALAVLLLAGSTSTTWPTSRSATRSLAPVSSSTTCAPPVAYSWPLTNTLPKALIAPEELLVVTPVGPEVGPVETGLPAEPPPPPQAANAKASRDDKAQWADAVFMAVS